MSESHNNRSDTYFVLLVVALVFLIGALGGFAAHRLLAYRRAQAAAEPMTVFWEAWGQIEQNFYGDVPSAQIRTYGAIRGALDLLDSHTIFLEPQTGEVERDRLSGAYGGIGVDIWRDGRGNVILSPYPGSPAGEAGVEERDQLVAVDGRSVVTATIDEIRVQLRGEVGTEVTLTLERPPAPPFDLTLIREEIQIPSVTYRVLEESPTTGYLEISSFTGRTPQETRLALDALLHAGVTELILDLRDNGGGLIGPATEVADLFLNDGVILYEIRQGGEEQPTDAEPGGPATELPLVVLVNRSTASAAEIVAGAIQRLDRGVLVGESTYGKGSVQLIFGLSDGSSVHITSAKWLLPDQEPVEPDGLTPDVVVAQSDELMDAQLERAREYLESSE
ncbi:MAG: S41 family peptidase [Anaerolineae bacterium]